VSPEEKCVALREKEHVKEICLLISTLSPLFPHVKALCTKERQASMELLYERCCGLDIHKNTVVACVMITPPKGRVKKSIRTFGTTTSDILALRDWVDAQQVTHLAMESTGIFWRPFYNLLEEGHTLILVNPYDMKAVPGRKTDVKDCEWIADLLRHGLLKLKCPFLPSLFGICEI
jgi:transposase